MPAKIELGLGVIGLGRPWGHIPGEVPSESAAIKLLERAYEIGIRYFDSAPSYGVAEERLGKFLASLDRHERSQVRIATKFGEHWDVQRQQPFVDHSYDALCRSLDASLERLGRIDILQLHKTNPGALASRDLERAWNHARQLCVPMIGVSVSDPESADMTIGEARYTVIQLPLNRTDVKFSTAVAQAAARGMLVAINRPFAMGAMLYGEKAVSAEEAFRFVVEHGFTGVVLTGTKMEAHLLRNWRAFQAVV